MSHAAQRTAHGKKGFQPGNAGGVVGNAGRGTKLFTKEDEKRFLKKYRKFMDVERAARAIGFRSTAIYRRKRNSESFAAKLQKVRQEGVESLVDKMLRFAHGRELPVHNGQLTAMFGVLRAFQPETWRENSKLSLSAEGDLATFLQGMSSALAAVNTDTKLLPLGSECEAPPALEHKE